MNSIYRSPPIICSPAYIYTDRETDRHAYIHNKYIWKGRLTIFQKGGTQEGGINTLWELCFILSHVTASILFYFICESVSNTTISKCALNTEP